MCLTILQNVKTPLQTIKQQVKKLGFYQRDVKNLSIFQSFSFQTKLDSRICFTGQGQTKIEQFKKSRKTGICPKRLVHGFDQKLEIFHVFLFQAKQDSIMCFTIFQSKKYAFLNYKNKQVKRSRKTGIFPKGIVYRLGQKLATVPFFSFLVKLARKMCFMIFQKEKPPLRTIKQ